MLPDVKRSNRADHGAAEQGSGGDSGYRGFDRGGTLETLLMALTLIDISLVNCSTFRYQSKDRSSRMIRLTMTQLEFTNTVDINRIETGVVDHHLEESI